MANTNPGSLRFIKDSESKTGVSLIVYVRDIRPIKTSSITTTIARANFLQGRTRLNCGGEYLTPRVKVDIICTSKKRLKTLRAESIMEKMPLLS